MKIIMLADLHYAPSVPQNGNRTERKLMQYALPLIDKLTDKINKTADMALCLGDLIEDFNDHGKDIENLNFIREKLGEIKKPFHTCLGNHDLRSMSSRRETEQALGLEKSTYSFDFGGLHIVMLTTFVNNGVTAVSGGIYKTQFLSDTDLDWLRTDLEANTLPTIICTHFGVAEDDMAGNWWFWNKPQAALLGNRNELKEILENDSNVLGVFSGHQHWTKTHSENGISYFVLGSLTEDIKGNGKPDGVYFEIDFADNKINVTEKHLEVLV